jgi:protein transport protein SEC61 subunit gamma-like protein
MSGIMDKGWEAQRRVEERAKRIGKGKYGRVLRMARKPTNEEYAKVVTVTGLGLILIGALGFFIYLMMTAFPGWISGLFK